MNPYISYVSAKNLWLFKSLEADFRPGINVIIGANASGKTSLLRVITLCFNIQALSKSIYSTNTSFHITIQEPGGGHFSAGVTSIQKDNNIYQGNNIVFGRDNIGDKSFSPFPGVVPYNLLAIGANRHLEYENIVGFKKEPVREESKNEYDSKNTEYLDKTNLPSIKQWMINRYFMIDKEWADIESKNWQIIQSNLSLLAPDNQKIELVEIGRDLEPKFKVNDNICHLEELSSGFKSMISIIFSITKWIEEVNEGSERLIQNATGTVLIDEIDLHLHPSWQLTALDSLKKSFPNLQFIVTTHSPLIISSLNNQEFNLIQEIVNDSEGNYHLEKVNAYGDDMSVITTGIMHSPSRLMAAEKDLDHLNQLIETESIEEARQQFEQMREKYGDLPDLAYFETMINLLGTDK